MIKTMKRARKAHICEECKKEIAPGEKYYAFIFEAPMVVPMVVDIHKDCDPFPMIPVDERR